MACPGALWALPSSSSQLWAEAALPFTALPSSSAQLRWERGALIGAASLQRWVLGCMVFALDLFWGGSLPSFTCT